jgi:hypothetical protein
MRFSVVREHQYRIAVTFAESFDFVELRLGLE